MQCDKYISNVQISQVINVRLRKIKILNILQRLLHFLIKIIDKTSPEHI